MARPRTMIVAALTLLLFASSAEAQQCLPGGGGMLRTSVGGALESEIEWVNDGTTCTGAGNAYFVPVEFSHSVNGGTLVVTFQIKGIGKGETGDGLAAQVSITGDAVEMGMFRTAPEGCTVDVTEHVLVEDGPIQSYRVSGRGACDGAVDSAYDDRSMTIAEFEFVGRTTLTQ